MKMNREDKFWGIVVLALIYAVLRIAGYWNVDAYASTMVDLDHTYPKTTLVTEVNGNHITVVDSEGRTWKFYDTEESWAIGDIASLTMFDRGTISVYDDMVIDAQYDGWLERLSHYDYSR